MGVLTTDEVLAKLIEELLEKLRPLVDESYDLLHTSWPDIEDWEPIAVEQFADNLVAAILEAV